MSPIMALEDVLPTKWSRRIALSTLPIAIGAVSLVEFLNPVLPSTKEANLRFLQISLFLVIALIGVIAVLALIVLHYRNVVPPVAEKYLSLPEHKRVIKVISIINNPTVEKIAKASNLSEETVEHWLAHWREHPQHIKPHDPIALTEDGHRLAARL